MPEASAPPALSTDRLGALARRLDRDAAAGSIAGAAIVVGRRDGIAFAHEAGFRDAAARDPLRPDAVWRISSMTRPIVSVAAMALVERGEPCPDQPVADLLPAFARLLVAVEGGTVPALGAPTVQDLMRHTAGLACGDRDGGPGGQGARRGRVLRGGSAARRRRGPPGRAAARSPAGDRLALQPRRRGAGVGQAVADIRQLQACEAVQRLTVKRCFDVSLTDSGERHGLRGRRRRADPPSWRDAAMRRTSYTRMNIWGIRVTRLRAYALLGRFLPRLGPLAGRLSGLFSGRAHAGPSVASAGPAEGPWCPGVAAMAPAKARSGPIRARLVTAPRCRARDACEGQPVTATRAAPPRCRSRMRSRISGPAPRQAAGIALCESG